MTEKNGTKKELTLTSQSPNSKNNSTKSISQKNNNQNSKNHKRAGGIKHFTINSRTTTLALKFYPEQLLDDEVRMKMTNPKTGRVDYLAWADGNFLDWCKNEVKRSVKNFEKNFDLTSAKQAKKVTHHWEIEAIMHDRDQVANETDMFEPSIVKPHFHLILRESNGHRFTVRHTLKALNLKYNSKLDSDLFYNNGATPIKDFNAYSCYLTHDTQQAIDDGKEHYDIGELFTNMSLDELQDIRDGYKRFRPKAKLRDSDWNKMANEVEKLGQSMGDFDEWTKNHLTFAQTATSKYKSLQNLFVKNLHEAVDTSPDITKCVILIHGEPNDGKSYTSKLALNSLGEKIYKAHTGSGKYDGLSRHHTAIIFDDRNMSDALSITDNQATILHGRGTANDRPFLGHYVICLTNLRPDDWFNLQGIQDSQLKALKSRFYVCSLKYDSNQVGKLFLDSKNSVSIRGTSNDIQKRNDLFTNFYNKFNKLIKGYHPLTKEEVPELPSNFFADSFDDNFKFSDSDLTVNSNDFELREKFNSLENGFFKLTNLVNSGQVSYVILLSSLFSPVMCANVKKDLEENYSLDRKIIFEKGDMKIRTERQLSEFLNHIADWESWLGTSYTYAYIKNEI